MAFLYQNINSEGSLFVVCSGQPIPNDAMLDLLKNDTQAYNNIQLPNFEFWRDITKSMLPGSELPYQFFVTLYDETGGNLIFTGELLRNIIQTVVVQPL